MSKGIVTEYNDYCVFCGKPTEAQHHLIWGKGNRDKAENDGIKAITWGMSLNVYMKIRWPRRYPK